jgi:hypothetical protein
MTTRDELIAKYGDSEQHHFRAVDTIGVPHPYMIGTKHVAWAADHWNGILGNAAIEDAEKHGIKCEICKKNRLGLKYEDHKQALVIECDLDMSVLDDIDPSIKKWNPEIHEYLNKIKDQVQKDGYEGFAFLDNSKVKKK